MKLSSNNSTTTTILGLLSVLLVAFPAATAINAAGASRGTVSRKLVDCTEADFIVTEFITSEGGTNTTQAGYEGCYEEADTNDDDLELSFYKIDGSLTAAGAAFYADDNNGGYPEPIWFFAVVEAGTSAGNASSSFLCFDLDLNAAETTHPADVTSWGLARDEDMGEVSRVCDITFTCGCTVAVTAAPTSAPATSMPAGDDDSVVDEATDGDAAFGLTTGGTFLVMALSSAVLAVANWL